MIALGPSLNLPPHMLLPFGVLEFAMPYRSLCLLTGISLMLAACDSGAEPDVQQQEVLSADKKLLSGEIDRSFAGTAMPQVTLTHVDGKTLELTSLRGEPLLVNLWATWCAPCVVEMPMLDNLAGEMGDELRVLTVSQDLTGAKAVTPFFAQREFANLEPWLDTANAMDAALENGGVLPFTILYNANGREVLRVVGGYEWDSEEAQAQIKEALAL
jgi:thiol-disulfide isomerase/thioredoxin